MDAIRGNGIWRSLDGGATWTHLASTTNNPAFYFVQSILYAENSGGPCGFGTEGVLAATSTGVYKSTDDGNTWAKVLGAGIAGATIDVAADLETDYYYTFATLGLVNSGGGGIFRSCNAGTTWEKIYQAGVDEQRIEISAHYLDAWQMYAVVQDISRGVKKIIKTSNADTVPASAVIWTAKTLPPFCNLTGATEYTVNQAWYDLIVAVAPIFRNPPVNDHFATVYTGGVDLHKTTNTGSSWRQMCEWYQGCGKPYVHADKHNVVFKPDPVNAGYFPNELLVATDGGVYRSTDSGATYTSRNKTYNITQFNSCAFHPTTSNYFLAGSQDNGTQKFTAAGLNATTAIYPSDNDGGFCYIDKDNPLIQIASSTYNNYFISTNGGASGFTYFPKNERGQFVNPTDYDNTANILYGGDDGGNYFRWTDPAINGASQQVSVANFNSARVTFVLVSPTIANRVYFGLSNGSVVSVDNANTGSSNIGVVIRPDLGTNYYLSCIAIDPADENHMLISYSNYGITSVYESSPGTGGSLNWNSIDNASLPDMPIRWCMFDPRNSHWAILATEMGIWSTDNLNRGSTNWQPTNNNFANTRVDMLRYKNSDRLLLAATHGRGLFSASIPAALPVTLLDFKGLLVDNEVMLQWKTSAEQNSKQFDIEKSTNGITFNKLGVVMAAGNSRVECTYQFQDKTISQEYNYYRLKQIDADERFEYSKTILIKSPVTGNAVFKVLNNPFSDHIDIQFGAITKGNGEIRLTDISGQILMKRSYELLPGSRLRININNQQLAAGVYILQVVIDKKQYSGRVLKK
jgi:photosystem II stability/assembly factor-like uncharacterized protein